MWPNEDGCVSPSSQLAHLRSAKILTAICSVDRGSGEPTSKVCNLTRSSVGEVVHWYLATSLEVANRAVSLAHRGREERERERQVSACAAAQYRILMRHTHKHTDGDKHAQIRSCMAGWVTASPEVPTTASGYFLRQQQQKTPARLRGLLLCHVHAACSPLRFSASPC